MSHPETHREGLGSYIKDIVYAANDGIVTTFAVVAGAAGAALSSEVMLILGFANLLADGFSMAASNFLGSRSEEELIHKEYRHEEREINETPDEEAREVGSILIERGFDESDATAMTALIRKNRHFWIDFMMKYELGVGGENKTNIRTASFLTFVSFVCAGCLPLIPFLILSATQYNLVLISSIAAGAAFFTVGSLRTIVTHKGWLISGLEMLFVGSIASGVAYGIGNLLSGIVGSV